MIQTLRVYEHCAWGI